jgi:copper(I)-binding protein
MTDTVKFFNILTFGKTCLATLSLAAVSAFAQAPAPAVKVEGAWARATVAGQQGTGAFMSLTAPSALKLVGVSSPVAGVAELHEMKMEGDIMRMRSVPAIELPAGTSVQLKPGGFHVMLMDLKVPLRKDTQVPLTLVLQNAQGQTSQVQVSVPVMLSAPAGAASGHGGHGAGHKH